MGALVVVGSAVLRFDLLFAARSIRSGKWELVGGDARGDEPKAIRDIFVSEFGCEVRCVTQILSDRRIDDWRDGRGTPRDAVLRPWQVQFPGEVHFDQAAGEPRPGYRLYDEARWLALDGLDAVSPWRDADWLTVLEVADRYRSDPDWQNASTAGW